MPCGSTERKGSAEIGMLITDAQDLRILTVKALEGHNKYSPSKGNLCDIITHNIVGSNHGYLKTFWRRLNLLSPHTPVLDLRFQLERLRLVLSEYIPKELQVNNLFENDQNCPNKNTI